MKKVLDYLEQLGLSQTESKLYLALLKFGPLTVQELAKIAGINRTATYTYIASLLDKGIIIEVRRQSRKKFIATQPENLRYIIERKLDVIHHIQQKFPTFLTAITTTLEKPQEENQVDVKYYKGRAGIKAIYAEALKAPDLRCYANLSQVAEVVSPDDLTMFDKALMKNKKITIYELVADIPELIVQFGLNKTKQSKRYFYKFIPTSVGLTAACILLYNNKVAIFNVKKNVSGIVLYNPDYYTNSKKLFDFIWNMLPEPNVI